VAATLLAERALRHSQVGRLGSEALVVGIRRIVAAEFQGGGRHLAAGFANRFYQAISSLRKFTSKSSEKIMPA